MVSAKRRALVVCPGRGSYTRSTLGWLSDRSSVVQSFLDTCDQFRLQNKRPTLREMDAASRFKASTHLVGENASLLTFACSMADFMEINRQEFEIVGVLGNSMGWYTALVAAGALSLNDGIRLVENMGQLQRGNKIGGQVLYPLQNDDWSVDQQRIELIESVLRQAQEEGHHAQWSIRLGSHGVLGADNSGVAFLMKNLPTIEQGGQSFPLQLAQHSAFHTSLMEEASSNALHLLPDLGLQAPRVALIDGTGFVHRPHWSCPQRLRHYTLVDQILRPYHFDTSLQTALQHCAPDVLILLGPGNSLGGPCASGLVRNHWRNLCSKDQLATVQESSEPAVLSFGHKQQREQIL
jgi:[acyl-carrier-protein] S-malonyltransferase